MWAKLGPKFSSFLLIQFALACFVFQVRVADDDLSTGVSRLAYTQGSVSFQPAGTNDWVTAGPREDRMAPSASQPKPQPNQPSTPSNVQPKPAEQPAERRNTRQNPSPPARNDRPATGPVHPDDNPSVVRTASHTSSANFQKKQQREEKQLRALQEQERWRVERQLEQEHAQAVQQLADHVQRKRMEQHREQKQQEKHAQEQKQLEQKQQEQKPPQERQDQSKKPEHPPAERL